MQILYYTILYHTIPYYTILYHTILVPYYTINYTTHYTRHYTRHHTIHHTMLYYTIHYTILHDTTRYYTIHYTILDYTTEWYIHGVHPHKLSSKFIELRKAWYLTCTVASPSGDSKCLCLGTKHRPVHQNRSAPDFH